MTNPPVTGQDIRRGITIDKEDWKQLAESEARFRFLTEKMEDIVWTLDLDLRTTYLSPSIDKVLGFTAEERIGQKVTDHLTPASETLVRTILARELARENEHSSPPEGTVTVSLEYYHRNGSTIWLESVISGIRDKNGVLTGIFGVSRDITERKRTEDTLRLASTYNRSLLEASPDPLVTISPEGKITDVNTATERVTGRLRNDLVGTDFFRYFTDPEKASRGYAQVFREGLVRDYPLEILHTDGHITPVLYNAAIYRDDEGMIQGVFATARDITRSRAAEAALRESEARYSALFTDSNSVSLLIDPDSGRIVDANEAAARYYGYTRNQLQTMGIFDLNHLPPEKVVSDLLRAKDGKAKHFYSTHYRADGERRYVEVYSGPITVHAKPLFYSIIHDITDRRMAVQALRESEERYRTLVDHIPDYVVVHRDGILLYANPVAAKRMGYSSDELVGKPILPFIAPEYHDAIRTAVARRMAGEAVPAYEMKILAKDGTYRMVLSHGSEITFEGRPASLIALSDITDRKLMEEEVRSLNRVLERRVEERTAALSKANEQLTAEIAARTHAEQEVIRSLQEKDLLLREIHHRVKNNLQIIASLLKLQSRHIGDPRVLESLNESQSRIRTMALVHERIYRSHNLAEISLHDYLNYLTRQIFQFYNIQQNQVGVSITMDEILTDIDTVTPLGLIVNELVSNSLKHAFPDSRKGMISIVCTAEDPDIVRIIYHDNGIGLPAGLDWKHTESLGLRLVNSLVDQLNGTIESGTGEGTTFVMTVRQKRSSHEAVPPPG